MYKRQQLISANTLYLEAERDARLKIIAANATATVNLARAVASAHVIREQFIEAGKALGAPCRVLKERHQQQNQGNNSTTGPIASVPSGNVTYSCVEFVKSEVLRLATKPVINFSSLRL